MPGAAPIVARRHRSQLRWSSSGAGVARRCPPTSMPRWSSLCAGATSGLPAARSASTCLAAAAAPVRAAAAFGAGAPAALSGPRILRRPVATRAAALFPPAPSVPLARRSRACRDAGRGPRRARRRCARASHRGPRAASLNTRILMSSCAIRLTSISCSTEGVRPCWPMLTTACRWCAFARSARRSADDRVVIRAFYRRRAAFARDANGYGRKAPPEEPLRQGVDRRACQRSLGQGSNPPRLSIARGVQADRARGKGSAVPPRNECRRPGRRAGQLDAGAARKARPPRANHRARPPAHRASPGRCRAAG